MTISKVTELCSYINRIAIIPILNFLVHPVTFSMFMCVLAKFENHHIEHNMMRVIANIRMLRLK